MFLHDFNQSMSEERSQELYPLFAVGHDVVISFTLGTITNSVALHYSKHRFS
jgi:hypothetical protein